MPTNHAQAAYTPSPTGVLAVSPSMPSRQSLPRLILVLGLASVCSVAPASEAAKTDPALTPPKGALDWDTGANQSTIIPALEIPSFLVALNVYDRGVYGSGVYGTTARGTWDHLRNEPWQYDDDPFNVNQFSHPYLGATLYGFARSSGLNFWQSLLYSNVGSFTWEMAGEKGPPSINDFITTGQAGSLLGESLFRMANLVLEKGGSQPGIWRELGAAVLAPSLGFNRCVYGDRFKTLFPSHDPATFWQLQLGGSADATVSDNNVLNSVRRQEAALEFSMAYGLPGQPGYTYDRPFDYFQFEFAALSSAHTHNWLEDIFAAASYGGRPMSPAIAMTGCWAFLGATILSRRRSFGSQARPCHSAPRPSGGWRRRSRCRDPCWAEWDLGPRAPIHSGESATTITA